MFADTFHDRLSDAMTEAARRRADPSARDLVTQVGESPYGGYRVRSMPADFYVDQIADGPGIFGGTLRRLSFADFDHRQRYHSNDRILRAAEHGLFW